MSEPINADIQTEGHRLDIDVSLDRLAEKNKGEDTPTDSQPGKKPKVEEPSQKGESDKGKPANDNTSDEQLPFHKHPRWQKSQKELAELHEKLNGYDEMKARLDKLEGSTKKLELPGWWKEAYGEDDKSQTAYKNYEAATRAERDRIRDEAIASVKEELGRESKEAEEGKQYVETQISEMKDEGLKFDQNLLLKFMVDFQNEYGPGSLLDKDNNYDFRKALKLMNQMQPPQEDDSGETRKRIAGDAVRTKARSAPDKEVPVINTNALRRGTWRDAERR